MIGRMLRRRDLIVFMAPLPVVAQGVVREKAPRKTYIVLISGETELESERTLVNLAQELEGRHKMRCSVLVAEEQRELPGIDALEEADMIILFASALRLPASQMKQIRDYLAAGKPLLALGPSLKAFDNWPEFGADVLGAGSGSGPSGDAPVPIKVAPESASHPVLAGLPPTLTARAPFRGALTGNAKPLLIADAPIAWYRMAKNSRIVYSAICHREDIETPAMRSLVVNAIYWAQNKPAPAR
jgi:hypothetical protein